MISVSLTIVRPRNASSFIDSIDGLFIADVGTFGEDGEVRPVVFERATLVVVVGRAPSSSLNVRSTSSSSGSRGGGRRSGQGEVPPRGVFMLLFKLLVILWNEKKH
jgi:hypothetical protein